MNDQQNQRLTYLSWRDMRFAIQESLVKPFGYLDKEEKRPMGILNHLYKMKMSTDT